jgi:hypothetical protein
MSTKPAPLKIGQTVISTIRSLNVRTGIITETREYHAHTGIHLVTVQWDGIRWPELQDSRDLEVVA